jgi:hypothetical protein
MKVSKAEQEILRYAIIGMKAERDALDKRIEDVRALVVFAPTKSPIVDKPIATWRTMRKPSYVATGEEIPMAEGKRPRKKFSAATRRKMAASQKARWAAKKAQSGKVAKSKSKAT